MSAPLPLATRLGAVAVFLATAAMTCGVIHCAAPGILGGPTLETTTVPCPDGIRCPNAYPLCPQFPGERCQADSPEIETGGARRDAGNDAAPEAGH